MWLLDSSSAEQGKKRRYSCSAKKLFWEEWPDSSLDKKKNLLNFNYDCNLFWILLCFKVTAHFSASFKSKSNWQQLLFSWRGTQVKDHFIKKELLATGYCETLGFQLWKMIPLGRQKYTYNIFKRRSFSQIWIFQTDVPW